MSSHLCVTAQHHVSSPAVRRELPDVAAAVTLCKSAQCEITLTVTWGEPLDTETTHKHRQIADLQDLQSNAVYKK